MYDKIYLRENKHFTDLKGAFQSYRISNILKLYFPKKEEKVLDLGCGWGTFCFALAPFCKEITGIDYSAKSIELCEKILKRYGYKNVKFFCRDAKKTGLKEKNYDLIICADLVEHLYREDFEKVLDECQRLLKIGGKLLIWTPHRGHIFEIMKNRNIILKKDITHVDYKSMEYIVESLKKRNFKIVKSHYLQSHFPYLRIIEKYTLRILPFMRRRIAILAEKS